MAIGGTEVVGSEMRRIQEEGSIYRTVMILVLVLILTQSQS